MPANKSACDCFAGVGVHRYAGETAIPEGACLTPTGWIVSGLCPQCLDDPHLGDIISRILRNASKAGRCTCSGKAVAHGFHDATSAPPGAHLTPMGWAIVGLCPRCLNDPLSVEVLRILRDATESPD